MPSQAVHEPLELALRVIEARSYSRAKHIIDRAEKDSDIPDDPMIDTVWEIQREIVRDLREAKRAKS